MKKLGRLHLSLFSANFPEHGIKVLPVFEVYAPAVNLAVDDKFTLYWTILRELN